MARRLGVATALLALVVTGLVAPGGAAGALPDPLDPGLGVKANGTFSAEFVWTSPPGSGPESWEIEGSLDRQVVWSIFGDYPSPSQASLDFTMSGHAPSSGVEGASGTVDSIDIQAWSGSASLRWGSYTRVGDGFHATVVADVPDFHLAGSDGGTVTIELEGTVTDDAFLAPVPGTFFSCDSGDPCDVDGAFNVYEGDRGSTVPEGQMAGGGGSPWSPPEPPEWSDTRVEQEGTGTPISELRWQYQRGKSRWCGPEASGDGWRCVGPWPNKVRYTGFADNWDTEYYDSQLMRGGTVVDWLFVGCGGSAQTYCSFPNNTYDPSTNWPPPESAWHHYNTNSGGQFSLDYYYEYNDGGSDDPESRTRGPWTVGTFPTISTTGNTNVAPVVELGKPLDRTIHRDAPGELPVEFLYSATDKEGHNWNGDLRVYEPSGGQVAQVTSSKMRSGATVKTVGLTLPHSDGSYENGTYTFEVQATDTSGTSTDTGDWKTGTFDLVFNLAPEVPSLIAPLPTVPVGPTPTFAIDTIDPEDDPYFGIIEIRDGLTGNVLPIDLETAPAASDTLAVAQLTEALEPGEYEWRARAEDVLLAGDPLQSFSSGWRPFTVADAPEAGNSSPAPPTLVAPSDGHTFAHDAGQTFTIEAVDPDGDDYLGQVSVIDQGSGEETLFTTSLTASGTPSSGSPVQRFGPGDYQWSARAIDERGGTGAFATPQSEFSVAEPPPPPPNDPPAASLVSPADGHEFGSNDEQVFTVSATDPDGDDWHAEVEIDNSPACETSEVSSGQNASCSPFPPVGAGEHTWRARAVDDRGLEGPWTATREFTVVEGSEPNTPAPVEPADGHTFPTGEPQVFAVNADDPDGDVYRAEIEVKQGATVATFETAESPSGVNSYGLPDDTLPPGDYTWTARAVDVHGNQSGWFSPEASFTVNSPPETPTLVGPDDGKTFDPGEPQVFTVNSTDADGHDYRGTITVEDAASGAPVAEFDTQRVASGANASGSPLVRLPEGDYRWSATASDDHAGTSSPSGKRGFTVT